MNKEFYLKIEHLVGEETMKSIETCPHCSKLFRLLKDITLGSLEVTSAEIRERAQEVQSEICDRRAKLWEEKEKREELGMFLAGPMKESK